MLRKLMLSILAGTTLTGSAMAADLTSMSWDGIVAQAKEEGEVTWFQWYFEDRFRNVVPAFEEQYGIKVNLPDLDGGDAGLNKVMAEAGRETGAVDVLSISGDKTKAISPSDFFIGPILSLLPEANAVTDKAQGGDWGGYAIKFWGNQTGMGYDSNRVNLEDLPQTVAELETWMAANPQQLGFNFENGGSGPSFINNVARNILGLTGDAEAPESLDLAPVFDWFVDHEDEYVLTTSNNDSYARINSGEFLMVPVWEDGIAGLIQSGEMGGHIKVYLPEWGMNGGGNVVAIPKNAPHPAAALVFISWLTSAETQTELNKTFGSAPSNSNSDDSFALISNAERANSTNWSGGALPADAVVPAVIENVFQR
ncbi:extracellular solute-binding protein [Primorskyibacter aestuariivivens]|uniref:extracellular solute-binding protein n=1 Tax=Primorskyibacter aestuariivivens TaxID=1888912 RepID=UPI002301ECC0|nr:extracellular solute-binding protein [Primorskyibacter aestuariivivens]MDA7430638.1 extracellular solute-binding protein [Primorskyibacter aestuariivivens]